ncbi:MAG: hypothetical protein MRY79_05290 [Alphaproteobacteria bacterium]|nr:hypothetical protein [Alphaproteobacteria bacterium]
MKIFVNIFFLGLLLLLIGGFGYFALTDVPVTQEEVSKTITLSNLSESGE